MTLERIKQIAQESVICGIDQLRRTGSAIQMFHLIGREGGREIVACAEDVTNNEAAKYRLSLQLKARVARGDIDAVIMISDIWYAEMSPEVAAVKGRRGLTVSEAHDLGLCVKKEALIVLIETPIYAAHVRQKYHRERERIVLDGEPEWQEGLATTGRFAGYWPRTATEARAS